MAQTSVERTLGILLAKVEGIEKSIADGDKHRAVVHRRVDEVVESLGGLSTEVATMKADVVDSKKITDEVKQWKQRGIGALFVSGVAGSAIGGVAVAFVIYWWEAIMRAIRAA
ncbi:DUF1515 domain-containing protein [Mesorhizobium sp. NZP2234]|uniref:DUF1515 family protein n=1 Tax=Mesorhizobium sp. NZP2234 TaxID=2483402 RepID=UPI0015985F52|nr:DUF1515 family protein [Mesorhizobium sp. NZP2234]QKC90018.1 DUF1515 domain-containing protein [Mesorhizobium sp. NZP2234]